MSTYWSQDILVVIFNMFALVDFHPLSSVLACIVVGCHILTNLLGFAFHNACHSNPKCFRCGVAIAGDGLLVNGLGIEILLDVDGEARFAEIVLCL